MACTFDGMFEKMGKYWVIKDKDGAAWPVLYCPICGAKIDYGEEEKKEE